MKKAYLFAYSGAVGTQDQITAVLNELAEVITWRYDLPHAIYIVSESDSATLSNLLRTKLGNRGRFIITEISENRQGWLPPDTWYFIRNKRVKPSK